MGEMNLKHPTAIQSTMNHAKNFIQHRDVDWRNNERGSIFGAATVYLLGIVHIVILIC
jgi:hypothetical protein